MKYTRSAFLKTLGLGSLAATSGILKAAAKNPPVTNNQPLSSSLKLGLASYSTRKFTLEQTMTMAQRLSLKHVCLKSMHLPLDGSDEELKKVKETFEKAGLRLYGAGVVYMKSEDQVTNAFRYAKAAGMEVIIGVPNHDLLPLVEEQVKATGIKLAIHNHGPGDKVYPTPKSIYDKVKDMDKRMGLCIDIGHVKRLGMDPIVDLKRYADRLYDLHLKDVSKAEAAGHSVEFGRGVIDMPKVLETLKEINYQGVMAIEYEEDADDVLPGLAECVGYTNGVLQATA